MHPGRNPRGRHAAPRSVRPQQKSRPLGRLLLVESESGFCSFGAHTGFARGILALQIGFTTTTFLNLVALLSHINLYIRGLFRLCGATMDMRPGRFNLYLLTLLGVLVLCGCQTNKNKSGDTVLRVHVEARDDGGFTRKISVLRSPPVQMRIDDSPLVTEEQVTSAKVVEALGGFALVIKFDARARWLMDEYSSLNIGRHFAVFAQWGKKPAVARWIAAPIISNRISDGTLIFTPDTTREEAEQIARGLGHKTGLDKPVAEDKNEEKK